MNQLAKLVWTRSLRQAAWLAAIFAIVSSCSVEVEPPESIGSVQQALCMPGDICPSGGPCCNGLCCAAGASCCGSSCCSGSCCGGACCTGAGNCCSGGSCVAGTGVGACGKNGGFCQNCDDSNACMSDSCVSGSCSHSKVGDGASCPSGSCVNGACCTGCVDNGVCVAIGGQSMAQCGKAGVACGACSDTSVCTQDLCVSGVCSFTTPASANTVCRYAVGECDVPEMCSGTTCPTNGFKMANTPCTDEGNPCTVDVCNGSGACVHNPVANNTMCTDSNVCTQGDTCQGGVCVPGAPLPCNDNEDCTVDTCNRMTGCVFTKRANDETCTDGNDCTTGDKCTNGKCGGVGKDCNDNDPCTIDTCNATTQLCAHNPGADNTPCTNTSKCVVSASCKGGTCTPGPAVDCSDTNPCTKNTCDPATGCKVDPDPDAMCDDGDPCTTGEKCQGTACGVGTPIACDDCIANATCDKVTGGCKGTPKGDGEPCTGGGTCQGGLCSTHPPDAGAPDSAGQSPDATAGRPEAGTGAPDSSIAGSEGGLESTEEFFVRDPGGCACGIPARRRSSSAALALIFGLAGLFSIRRSPRRR
jgi:hypothetical protein